MNVIKNILRTLGVMISFAVFALLLAILATTMLIGGFLLLSSLPETTSDCICIVGLIICFIVIFAYVYQEVKQ